MSETLCEAQNLLQEYISPAIGGKSVKGRIYQAARDVGFTFSRTHTFWYGNARRIDPEEIDRIRATAAVKKAAPITSEKSNGQDFWATVTELRSQIAELKSHVEYLDRISRGNG